MDSGRIAYDDQAPVFEARAGIPDEAAARVAAAVRGHLPPGPGHLPPGPGHLPPGPGHLPPGPGHLLVEIGAGTGVIGRWLARPGVRYLGIDSSQGMLAVFRPRLRTGTEGILLRADADRPWPVPSGCASVIFGSRVLHLLQPAHAVAQASRVAHPDGAAFLCGRIEHSPDSPRAAARAKLRDLLGEHGLRPRPTGGRPTRLLAMAEAEGAEPLPPRVAAQWPETVSLTQVIDWWRGKTSIGGINPPPEVAEAILAALTSWAAAHRPDTAVTTTTRYLLEGVRLPAVAPGDRRVPPGSPDQEGVTQ